MRNPDRKLAAAAIEDFLRALGFELEGELSGTGQRVAEAYENDLLAGYRTDPNVLLRSGSIDLGDPPHPIVAVRNIAISCVCPHHLMPSHGFATVAFLPGRLSAGLGTIAQAVHAHSRRFALQEHLGRDIANCLTSALEARGSLCHLAMRHTCLSSRGEREAAAMVESVALTGSCLHEDRGLALALLHGEKHPL